MEQGCALRVAGFGKRLPGVGFGLSVSKITQAEIEGTLSCTGLTDMSAKQDALPVQDVKFTAKVK